MESFRVTYDGVALEDGTMTVRDLAGALLAIGKAVEDANRVLNGDKSRIKVTVKAVKAGSCTIDLLCDQSWFQAFKDFFTGEDLVTLTALLGFLGFSAKDIAKGATSTLLRFVKWVRGRAIKSISTMQSGSVTVVLEDGAEADVPEPVVRLYQDKAVRRSLADMVKPLEREGIDTVATGTEKETMEVLSKEDLPAFEVPDLEREPVLEDTYERAFTIVALAFKGGNKWRLFDGENTISVKVADENFLNRIENRQESFAKDDVLRCRIRTTQWRTAGGLRVEHELLEVLDHKSSMQQMELPFN